MRLVTFALVLLQAATPAQQKRVAWIPNPRPAGGWVADPSHHLKPTTIDSLNALAAALERETSDEIAVVVVDSTSGLGPDDFALAVHRAWGVGKASRDNGVVVLWVPAQRALQVSVGYGLEGRLIDGRVGRIRDEQFFPAFKAKEFDRGMLDGVGALIAAAREEGTPVERFKPGTHDAAERAQRKSFVGYLIAALIVIPLALLGILFWVKTVGHRRHHPCPKCRARMRYIDDPAERLPLLDAGQRIEERLGSVHHDLWICPSCGAHDSDAHVKWLAIAPCPKCSYHTVAKDRATLVPATTQRQGQDIITSRCANCDYSKEEFVATPMITESVGGSSAGGSSFGGSGSSGGSSGGGGSFGGGSAGGGGAGGHY
jgi:uncharacterized protein